MTPKSRSTRRGTKAGAPLSFQKVAATPTTLAEINDTSYGQTDSQDSTGISFAHSETHQKAVKHNTRKRQPVAQSSRKNDPQTLLEIAQTALARLNQSGVQTVAFSDRGNIVITIVGATIDQENKVFTLVKPEPLYNTNQEKT